MFLFHSASNAPLPSVHSGEPQIRSIFAAIVLTEVVTKMVFYYVHERVWNRVSLGRAAEGASGDITKSRATDAPTAQPGARPLPHAA